ncbi:hypothetical protein CUMW_235800, partial [Citrus unshiu]
IDSQLNLRVFVHLVPERVRVVVRLQPRNAEETVTDVDFTDYVALQTELKRLKLRKNNWNSDTYEFDEKRVYEVVAKPVVEVFYGWYSCQYFNTIFQSSNICFINAVSLSSSSNVGSEYSQADDFRLTNTISDCLDLFDFSVDELSWSIFASQNPADLFAGLVWNVVGYVVGIRVLLEDGGLLGMGWIVAGCLHWSVRVWLLEYSH